MTQDTYRGAAMHRRTFAAAAASLLSASRGFAQAPERPKVSVAMGTFMIDFLPLVLADTLGLFRGQGLDVAVQNFSAGGAASLQALLGGSVDTVVASYDHTIQMQAQNKEIQAVALLNPVPGLVLGVRQDLADRVKGVKDFKGLRLGVTVPGAAGDFLMKYMLVNNGMQASDITFIGVGSGASCVAAVEKQQVDLILNYDPAITILEQRKLIVPLLDTRTEAGTHAAYGGDYPFLCLYSMRGFIDRNPATIQRMVTALVGSLAYITSHSSAEIADALPPAYLMGDKSLFVTILDRSRQSFSPDGRFDPQSLTTPLRVLSAFDPRIANAHIDLAKTYTNRFVDAASHAG
jgi:NitT/TauT family transport system substrate-binding protein